MGTPAGVVGLATIPRSGKWPDVWEGRTAQQEEQRLRDAGGWASGRVPFFRQWGGVDPVAAIEASRVTDRDSLTVSTAAAVAGWAEKDPAASMAWVSAQPENAERTAYVQAVLELDGAFHGNTQALPDTAAWLAAQLELPGIQPHADAFLQKWAQSDRDGAVSWTVEQVVEPFFRTRIFDTMMRQAVSGDAAAFQKTALWLQARPDSPGKDELLHAFVKTAAVFDSATSSSWASLIQDENLKRSAMKICADAARQALLPH